MIKLNLGPRAAKVGAVGAALAMGASALLVGAGSGTVANADPQQYNAIVGVGSDTTQDVMNAFAGYVPGSSLSQNNYTPVQSSAATGLRQIISFDATDPTTGALNTCIAPKPKLGNMYRPNGSGSGRNALARAYAAGTWGKAGVCGGARSIPGFVDFARSSGLGGTGTDVTYVPFARDYVGVAYYYNNGGTVQTGNVTLTKAQIQSLYSTATTAGSVASLQTITVAGMNGGNPIPVAPCGIQTGSGTYGFFNNTFLGGSTGSDQSATTFCRSLAGGNAASDPGGPGRLQESDGVALKAKGDAANTAGTPVMVVIPYSAANFIAQSNGRAKSQLGAGVDFANQSDVVANTVADRLPYKGTVPNLVPNETYYQSTVGSGRDVYNVFDASIFDPTTPGANLDFKSLFATPGQGLCSTDAGLVRAAFGFDAPKDKPCGDTTTQGAYGTGTS